jgi:hypothetical protein
MTGPGMSNTPTWSTIATMDKIAGAGTADQPDQPEAGRARRSGITTATAVSRCGNERMPVIGSVSHVPWPTWVRR